MQLSKEMNKKERKKRRRRKRQEKKDNNKKTKERSTSVNKRTDHEHECIRNESTNQSVSQRTNQFINQSRPGIYRISPPVTSNIFLLYLF